MLQALFPKETEILQHAANFLIFHYLVVMKEICSFWLQTGHFWSGGGEEVTDETVSDGVTL